eukprot:6285796-Alexandrium_andersonii.AAC.1
MSASLVGSEMCIRDSGDSHVAHAGALAASGPHPAPLAVQGLDLAAPFATCLLYTSDAADDM